MSELLPCPWCGELPNEFEDGEIQCSNKKCDMRPHARWGGPAVWNTRTPSDAAVWRPIETAPKDGTFVLLLGDSGYTTTPHRIEVGQWIPDYKECWTDHSGLRWTDGGTEPTHWMPLPAPPLAARTGEL